MTDAEFEKFCPTINAEYGWESSGTVYKHTDGMREGAAESAAGIAAARYCGMFPDSEVHLHRYESGAIAVWYRRKELREQFGASPQPVERDINKIAKAAITAHIGAKEAK